MGVLWSQVDALVISGTRSLKLNACLPRDQPPSCVQQPAWGQSREFDITTRSVSRSTVTQSTTGDILDDDEEDETLDHGHKKRKVAFEPSPGMPITSLPYSGTVPINALLPQKPHTPSTTEGTGSG